MAQEQLRSDLDQLRTHFGTLTDGVWEPRKDLRALVSLGALLTSGLLALERFGVI